VHSLFPSPKTEEGIKGGVVLLRLAPPAGISLAAAPPPRLEARYQDRSGKQYSTLRAVAVPAGVADVASSDAEGPTTLYQSTGVRLHSGLLLSYLQPEDDAVSRAALHVWRRPPATQLPLRLTCTAPLPCPLQVRKAVLLARLTDALQGW
jgi:Ca-activated chloride channel family protein